MNSFSGPDRAMMARALALAEMGLYTATPNPRVGCVLVKDGAVVGEGWHEKAGAPHAEANALAAAGGAAKGATAYVTLEPCNHHGRTPPCAHALIQAGVARVVAAVRDPNPKAELGAETLEAAGIASTSAIDRSLNRTASVARLNRAPRHSLQGTNKSGRKFISIFRCPWPRHASHRPPGALKLNRDALYPRRFASRVPANTLRISSNTPE